jgi:hypothetical protein
MDDYQAGMSFGFAILLAVVVAGWVGEKLGYIEESSYTNDLFYDSTY